jgi:acyl transferase domain-containing protein/acyl-CoA synthetase (AMP-forming)/AMP-acid ligase II/acyl carrier protein
MRKLDPRGTSQSATDPGTLVELLCNRAVSEPDRCLYSFLNENEEESGGLTCFELDRQAREIASLLLQCNASGERALLLYPPGLEFIAAFFGCLYAGVVAIPAPLPNPNRLNRTLPRLQAMVEDATVLFGLTTSKGLRGITETWSGAEGLPPVRWLATDGTGSENARQWTDPGIQPSDLAYLQYTSGSTASPKGVRVTHANVLHNSSYIREAWGYGPTSTSVVWIPYYHDDGLVHGLIQPLFSGYRAILMSPASFVQHPGRWLRAISRYRATHSGGPNFAYELCTRKVTPAEKTTLDLSSWRMAYNAAEPIRHETLRLFAETFESCGFRWDAFHPAYGLAEATLLVTTKATDLVSRSISLDALGQNNLIVDANETQRQTRLVGCGRPVGQTRIAIVDPTSSTECAQDQVGEIWISDASVANGYWNRPEENRRTFGASLVDTGEGPFLRTGDLGFVKGGELFVTGRLKDLIIIRGQNHYPQDIEIVAEKSHRALRPGCSAAFSVDVADEERLVIVLEVDTGVKPNPAPASSTEKSVAGDHLPDYQEVIACIRHAIAEKSELQPYAIVLLEPGSIQKTSSGKIQRQACRADYLAESLRVVAEWVQIQPDALPSERSGASTESREVGPSPEFLREWLILQLEQRLGISRAEIDLRTPVARYGLDSKQALSLVGDLEILLQRRLIPTLVYEHSTVNDLVDYLVQRPAKRSSRAFGAQNVEREPIAIIGLGCRFPGADDPKAFWKLVHDGVDAISEVPARRWKIGEFYDPDPMVPGKINTRWGGFLGQVDGFDPDFFRISRREAARMDPQQRLLLEVAWEALQDAGQPTEQLEGSPVGVFIGISTNEYGWLQLSDPSRIDAHWGTGNSWSIAANRISYVFNFRGPSVALDTACSSSLAAVHMACQSLLSGESSLALAGGVSLILSPAFTINFTKAGAMAPDGRCKAFDARANGYVRGEGAGIVILKRLSDALNDGDPVYAVILGSALNNDGRSNGLMAPSREAQEAVLTEAYRRAGVSPARVQYVEAHGSGTALGDPIEARAIGAVVSPGRSKAEPCAIGSVKTNIGHLEAAAGIAGLIKVALSLKHQLIPPSLHFESANPLIPFDQLGLRVQQKLTPWSVGDAQPLAGVSSFGFGGANAHLVLQAHQDPREAALTETPIMHLLPLSAHSSTALSALATSYASLLDDDTKENLSLADLCYSAALRRDHHAYRVAVSGRTRDELIQRLLSVVRDGLPAAFASPVPADGQPGTVFVFSGQGSQWIGMGKDLFEREPLFRESIESCERAFSRYVEWSLIEVLTGVNQSAQLDRLDIIQPAIFAIQVSLAALWRSWGVEPSAIVGQSMGEIAAACVAGALSLDDASLVICHRSRLLTQISGKGQMAAVELSLEESKRMLVGYEDRVSVAVSNGPTSTVLSGEPNAIGEIVEQLRNRDIFCRPVNVDFASHSPQVDPIRDQLLHGLESLQPRRSTVPVYSTVTGELAGDDEFNAEYWWRNLREPVLFSTVVEGLLNRDHHVFLEISPNPILLNAIQQMAHHLNRGVTLLPSLRRDEEARVVMLASLAAFYTFGSPIRWSALYPDGGRCVPLPSYPWQREHCWLDIPSEETGSSTETTRDGGELLPYHRVSSALLGQAGRSEVEESVPARSQPEAEVDWFYETEWQRRPHPLADTSPGWRDYYATDNLLIFADSLGFGEQLRSRLEESGCACSLVFPGQQYLSLGFGRYQINPESPDDFSRLLEEVGAQSEKLSADILHLWSLDAPNGPDISLADLNRAQVLGCVSVLHLVQALAKQRALVLVDDLNVAPDSAAGARLFIVTSGAQSVETDLEAVSISQSPVWGLARTIQKEQPELGCKLVDIGSADAHEEIQPLLNEILVPDAEDQLAFRGGTRFVARLVRRRSQISDRMRPAAVDEPLVVSADHHYRVELSRPGVLDDLTLRATKQPELRPRDVKIRVSAGGLNFVDVLRALKLVPAPSDGPLLPGGECSGRIVALGESVTSFHVGDDVIAFSDGCFGSYATASASMVVPKPEGLTFRQAATIPAAFVTAYYALVRLANLTRGERVLIHSATGGVGLAAVQIARQAGAEIFATAGTEEKREYLRSLGVSHVMDSRSLAFADQVMDFTKGQGVDVVLNSLSGDAIDASLSTLRAYGRFLEIGKRDIASDRQIGLSPFQKNLSFFAIDLNRMCLERPTVVGGLLKEVVEQVRKGALKPLPLLDFPISNSAEAFHTMARARHIGKIVLSVPARGTLSILPNADPDPLFRSDATYLLSGGTGALSLAVARWMVDEGARHLVLISRTGASGNEAAIDEIGKSGAQVVVAKADVAQEQELSRVLEEIERTMPPLKGVLHFAGILDDGVLTELNRARLDAVMAAKVSGAWNLHNQTLKMPLDLFVQFSSAASLLGSAGQSNYAAANAFLDALAHYRRSLDLPAMSINWGPWQGVGLAAKPHRGERLGLLGVQSIVPSEGIRLLQELLRWNPVQAAVMRVDWDRWQESHRGAGGSSFLHDLLDENRSMAREGSPVLGDRAKAQAILTADPQMRRDRIESCLRDGVAWALGLTSVETDRPLNKMGLDSLLAVQLKHRLENDLGIVLPVAKLLEGADIGELTTFILDQQTAVASTELTWNEGSSGPDKEPAREAESDFGGGSYEDLLPYVNQLLESELDSLLDGLLPRSEAD